MLVWRLLSPPVTMMSPLGQIATPGQNMSWLVLLIVCGLTWPVVRSKMAVCVMFWPLPKFMFWSADHTTILLLGRTAAATGTSGNPIVGPHWPTTEGSVLRFGTVIGGDCTAAAPCREIPAAA